MTAFRSFHPERPTYASHWVYKHSTHSLKDVHFTVLVSRVFLNIPKLVSLSIIIQTVKGHPEDLICLTQAIPGPVVTLVHLDGMSKIGGGEKKVDLIEKKNSSRKGCWLCFT